MDAMEYIVMETSTEMLELHEHPSEDEWVIETMDDRVGDDESWILELVEKPGTTNISTKATSDGHLQGPADRGEGGQINVSECIHMVWRESKCTEGLCHQILDEGHTKNQEVGKEWVSTIEPA